MARNKLVFSALLCSGILTIGACGMHSDNDRGRANQNSSRGSDSNRATGSVSSSSQTSQVQQALKAKGYDPGTTDAQTQEALRKFQQANGLPATGKLDAQTAKALGVPSSGTGSTSGSSRESGTGSSTGSSTPNSGSGTNSGDPSRTR